MSSKTKSKTNLAGKLLLLCRHEYNRVQQSCMGWPNEHNIIQHRKKQKKCCIVQHLFSEKFDRDQTSYNKIQHDKTRYNKVAKRVQHFIKHQRFMMLYEMLYSFGRGLKPRDSCLPSHTKYMITQKMADQGWSNLDVVFTMILCATNVFIW